MEISHSVVFLHNSLKGKTSIDVFKHSFVFLEKLEEGFKKYKQTMILKKIVYTEMCSELKKIVFMV